LFLLLADFGFSDVETAQLQSIAVTTLSSKGTLALNGSTVTLGQSISRSNIEAGNLKFTPAANANGTGYDSFKFTVNDGTADSSASSTMTIDVTAVNDLPTEQIRRSLRQKTRRLFLLSQTSVLATLIAVLSCRVLQ
jgi:hypothetical protein